MSEVADALDHTESHAYFEGDDDWNPSLEDDELGSIGFDLGVSTLSFSL